MGKRRSNAVGGQEQYTADELALPGRTQEPRKLLSR
jgi:hypothetical protein